MTIADRINRMRVRNAYGKIRVGDVVVVAQGATSRIAVRVTGKPKGQHGAIEGMRANEVAGVSAFPVPCRFYGADVVAILDRPEKGDAR